MSKPFSEALPAWIFDVNPVYIGQGYFILDMSPGAINHWRPLGRTDRPLKTLMEFEAALHE